MNKIDRAIQDTEIHIQHLREECRIMLAKIAAYDDQLKVLIAIKNDNSIPYLDEEKIKF